MRARAFALSAVLALMAAPAAEACSLRYLPFEQARFEGSDLWYTSGDALRQVSGNLERTHANAFVLSHAHDGAGRLLVGGQDGLGADCSGERWLELRDGDRAVWRRAEGGRVFHHPAGPFVEAGDRYFRLDGDELVPHGQGPKGTWVLGWTGEGAPVFQQGREVRVGDGVFPLAPEGRAAAAASHGPAVAVVQELTAQVRLHVVEGGQLRNVTWDLVGEDWQHDVAWAGAWVVLAGGRAYRVDDRDVQDLGVADAVAIAARGDSPVVFTEEGYTVFKDSRPTEAWTRSADGTWTAVPPRVGPHQMVRPVFEPATPLPAPADPSGGARGGPDDDGDGVLEVPFASAGPVALAALGLAAVVLRRRGR